MSFAFVSFFRFVCVSCVRVPHCVCVCVCLRVCVCVCACVQRYRYYHEDAKSGVLVGLDGITRFVVNAHTHRHTHTHFHTHTTHIHARTHTHTHKNRGSQLGMYDFATST